MASAKVIVGLKSPENFVLTVGIGYYWAFSVETYIVQRIIEPSTSLA